MIESTMFFKVTHPQYARIGVMAWMADGRTLQYLAESGEFHDNPAILDDLAYEHFNRYTEVKPSDVPSLLTEVRPYESLSLQWIVDRFLCQSRSERVEVASFGFPTAAISKQSESRPASVRKSNDSLCPTSKSDESLPPIEWLWNLLNTKYKEQPAHPILNEVNRLVLAAISSEPAITHDILASAGTCRVFGIEHRVKTPDSLARKIITWVIARTLTAPDLSIKQIAGEVADSIRYSLITANHNDLLFFAQNTYNSLITRGYSLVAAEHSYVELNVYKGFRTVWKSSTGQLFELQFRSDLNLKIKEIAYPYYKASRDFSKSLDERRKCFAQTALLYATLPTPFGLDSEAKLGNVIIKPRIFQNPFDGRFK